MLCRLEASSHGCCSILSIVSAIRIVLDDVPHISQVGEGGARVLAFQITKPPCQCSGWVALRSTYATFAFRSPTGRSAPPQENLLLLCLRRRHHRLCFQYIICIRWSIYRRRCKVPASQRILSISLFNTNCILRIDSSRVNANELIGDGADGFIVLDETHALNIPRLLGCLRPHGKIDAHIDNELHLWHSEVGEEVHETLYHVLGSAKCA